MIEGEFGFYGLIEGAGDTARLLDEWTRPWRITQVSHKPFPSGRATHSAIDGTLRLRRRHGLHADQVAKRPHRSSLDDQPSVCPSPHSRPHS